jgi:hypothetical protein
MRVLLASVSFFAAAFFCAPTFAQDDETLRTIDCGPLPYSVRVERVGGEVAGKLTADVLEGLLKNVPVGAQGQIGAEYMADAISGAAADAHNLVFNHYACRVRNAIIREVNAERMTSDDLEAFDQRQLAISEFYENAYDAAADSDASISEQTDAGEAADMAVRAIYDSEVERIRAAFAEGAISSRIRSRAQNAIAGVSPSDFTGLNRLVSWAKLRTNVGELAACGGIVTNVLEGVHGNLQTSLSSSRQFYASFFNATPTQSISLARSALRGYGRVVKDGANGANAPLDPMFMSCAERMLTRLDPAAAAEVTAERAAEAAASAPATQQEQPTSPTPATDGSATTDGAQPVAPSEAPASTTTPTPN